jgi:tRNA-specific 2-thiouridylase
VQWRAHGATTPASVRPGSAGLEVDLAEPAEAVAAGQTAVFYIGTRVVGSATVHAAWRVGSPATVPSNRPASTAVAP